MSTIEDLKNSSKKSDKTLERVYSYIKQYITNNMMSPSVRDICNGVGLKSTSSVHLYLKKLDEIGLIEYRPGIRRAIVIKADAEEPSDIYQASTSPLIVNKDSDIVRLPLLGKITAGQPIYATEDYSSSIAVNKSIIGDETHFILKVSGNSMVNAHILDGDYIIVKKQSMCELGDIIVALIDDSATVKRFGYKNKLPYLFPENDSYEPIPFHNADCRILGKVVGLHRYSIE